VAAFVGLAALGASAQAQVPEVRISVVPEFTGVQPGGRLRVAVRLQVPEGWHIGWVNPGAGGLPTTITWRLPAGLRDGGTEWPYPETDETGGEVSHVYRGAVVVFSSFEAQQDAAGPLDLSADLSWGMCKAVCVPQHRTVRVAVAAARGTTQRTSDWAEMEAARYRLPLRHTEARFAAKAGNGGIELTVTGLRGGPAPGTWVTFFPLEPRQGSVVAQAREAPGGIAVTLPGAAASGASADRLAGVLVAAHPPGLPPPVRALAVDVPIAK
jgi:thiol:disulfide interchange protein DsbD